MRCAQCGFENPERTKFCGGCGVPLRLRCGQCGADSPAGFKFCGECGAPLAAPHAAASAPRSSPPFEQGSQEAERRQLTVMFCDLVGSTPLSEQLDPEDLRTLLSDYQQATAHVIARYGGHIAKYLGDGILVYFGYPRAHEDDGFRAAHAALGMAEAVERLNRRPGHTQGVRLEVRIGIHTGLVVAGDMGSGDHFEANAIVGHTPNVAARLQSIAEPGTAVVSGTTYQLIRGFFHCEALGRQALKGVSEPVDAYRVLGESAARSRLEVEELTGQTLTPLVGRDRQIGELTGAWELAIAGSGQVVLLNGEAGIGKSRLVRALKEHAARNPDAWLTELRCSPFYQNTPLWPTVDLLERIVLQFDREDTAQSRTQKVEGFLAQYGLPLEENFPLFASLLSLPLGGYRPLDLNPLRLKQRTFEALLRILFTRAQTQPLLYVLEDVHWADPTTLELLEGIIERVPSARMCALVTTRPDVPFRTAHEAHVRRIALSRLPMREAATMIELVARGKELPEEVRRQLASRTDGVPLFVEELTKMVVESGDAAERSDRAAPHAGRRDPSIPATLQDSLTARLDRLGAAKTVAQVGSVLGREFSYDLIHAVAPRDRAQVRDDLVRLVDAEILYQRGALPDATFLFKHALIQDAAYQSILRSVRQQYHRQAARTLVDRFPEEADAGPELVAHHYTEAGMNAEAIPLWLKAARRSVQSSALLEAIAHLRSGLLLIPNMEECPERDGMELELQLQMGTSQIAARGYSAPEVESSFVRARALSNRLGHPLQRFRVSWGLWAFHIVRGRFREATALGRELEEIAQSQADNDLMLEVQPVLGHNYFWTGDLETARKHLELGVSMYDPQAHSQHALAYNQDPLVVCQSYLAWLYWLQGRPDAGCARSLEAIAQGQRIQPLFSLGYALAFAAFFHQLRDEPALAQQRADEAIALAVEQDYPVWAADGDMIRGWAVARLGRLDEGWSQFQRGFDAWDAAGARLCRTHHFGMLAELYGMAGDPARGLEAVEAGFRLAEEGGEAHYVAELHRLAGELLRRQSPDNGADAEGSFERAIAIARERGALSWELRAMTSLCRLWMAQGRAAPAQARLTAVLARFTEGFDTPDVRAASALLDEQEAQADG